MNRQQKHLQQLLCNDVRSFRNDVLDIMESYHLSFIFTNVIAVLPRSAVVRVGLESGIGNIFCNSETLNRQASIAGSVSDEIGAG